MVFLGEIGPWICALGYVPPRPDLNQFLGQAPGLAQCPLKAGGAAAMRSAADGHLNAARECMAMGITAHVLIAVAGCSGDGGEAVATQAPDAPEMMRPTYRQAGNFRIEATR